MRALKYLMIGTVFIIVLTSCSLWAKEHETVTVSELGSGPLRIWVAGESRPIDAFGKFTETTGIKVQAEFAPQSEWIQKILVNKGQPEADLFWSDNEIDLALLAGLGALESYESPFAATLPDFARDSKGRWHGLAECRLVIVYSASAMGGEVPETVEQLHHPEWSNQLIVPPLSSRLWDRFLADVVAFEGEAELQQRLEQLSEMNFAEAEQSIDDIARVAEGSVPALMTTSEAALQYMVGEQTAGEEIRIQPLRSEHTDKIDIITGIGILRGTEQLESARTFVDFILKGENRRDIAEQQAYDPLVEESPRDSDTTRLHPDEMVDLLPLIEHYWKKNLENHDGE